MRIIALRTLREFWQKSNYADSEQPLRAWYEEVKKADWKSPNEVKKQFKNASIVGNDRIVFNIKGNDYRLIVAMKYEFQIAFVRFIGTHKAYDRVDAKTI